MERRLHWAPALPNARPEASPACSRYHRNCDLIARFRPQMPGSLDMYRSLPRLSASFLPLVCLAALIGSAPVCGADFGPGFKTQSVAVDGGTVSITVGGTGPPV